MTSPGEEFNVPEAENRNLSVQDIQDYCAETSNTILAHGTTSDMLEGIEKDGLVIRGLKHPTVLSVEKGITNNSPVTEYKWVEPRSPNGEECSLILEIPIQIVNLLKENGLEVNQFNLFSLIYQKREFIVDEHSYDPSTPVVLRPPGDDLQILTETRTPKLDIGAKYEKDVIPKEFILAATTKDKVLYENKERFNLLSTQKQEEIINIAKERVQRL